MPPLTPRPFTRRRPAIRPPGWKPLILVLLWPVLLAAPAWADGHGEPAAQAGAAVQRGQYIFRATGGCGCHTDTPNKGPFLAGGRAIRTPFGTFFGTNITPHAQTGLGKWKEADFVRAMTQGVAPDGSHYFPVFPYTSFTRMTREDLADLWAYLRSVPPVKRANKPHDLGFPFNLRMGAWFWKWWNFRPGSYRPAADQPPDWNRGAYLSRALGHCGECHTPRGLMGAPVAAMRYAGSEDGPEGELAPNITPHRTTGIGEWTLNDMVWFLETGLKADGDDTQGLMSEMIENGYTHLSEADRRAIAVYLRSLPPINNALIRKNKAE